MRRFGEAVRPDAPYRERPGAYAVILSGREILLAATPNQGESLLLPGGGIDPGESPLPALHREVWEETGWRVRHVRRLGAFQRYCWMPDYSMWARKICHIHLCQAGRRLSEPYEPDHTPVWMDAEEAAERLSVSGERWFLRALLDGRV
ncbi:NUDIX domain-containing protein [Rhodovulum sp. DZ06]|uniref:NUDIX domain-containing protein n=1 Tax=Rhodovulum sp. DZ06 TaxID=3425126 RepID=UPI003D34E3CF